jgi:hypothetical protein
MVRKSLAVLCVVIFGVVTVPLDAQELPWCVKLDAFTKNCGFAKYEECVTVARDATSLATGVGQCVRNPDYQPPPATAKSTRPAPNKTASPQH